MHWYPPLCSQAFVSITSPCAHNACPQTTKLHVQRYKECTVDLSDVYHEPGKLLLVVFAAEGRRVPTICSSCSISLQPHSPILPQQKCCMTTEMHTDDASLTHCTPAQPTTKCVTTEVNTGNASHTHYTPTRQSTERRVQVCLSTRQCANASSHPNTAGTAELLLQQYWVLCTVWDPR